jgi:ethanolaminephosphotransferase
MCPREFYSNVVTDKTTDHSFQGGFYISPSGSQSLKGFQFSSVDHSPIYRYVLSPLASLLVERVTPTTVAPNSITLFGFSWMIASYCLIWYYCPTLGNAMIDGEYFPSWIFLFNGVAMLLYQTLDNMDGKQARRTSTSSPLGLLFDHGCDALNVVIGMTNWSCAMGLSPATDARLIALVVLSGMTTFYFTTWEEYHTGTMVMAFFNGPTEGILFGVSVSFISTFIGSKFWHQTQFYDLCFNRILRYVPMKTAVYLFLGTKIDFSVPMRNCECLILLTHALLARETISKVVHVAMRYGVSKLSGLLPFVILVSSAYSILLSMPSVFIRNPRLSLNLIGTLFVEMVLQLMLDHMTHDQFNPLRWTLAPLVYFTTLGTTMSEAEQDRFIFGYFIAISVYLAMKVRILVHEMCQCLRIWCFDIVTPYDNFNGRKRIKR